MGFARQQASLRGVKVLEAASKAEARWFNAARHGNTEEMQKQFGQGGRRE